VPVRHLYVHVPFCAHRCGYCDFVTVTGHGDRHAAYVEAVLGELAQERALLGDRLETLFLGGGTPTLIGPTLLRRLLAGLPAAEEVTVEANPETVDAAMAEALAGSGVTRVSVGAQSFGADELAVLERRARPEQVRSAVCLLREAGVPELSLDLLFGIPGETPDALERDLTCALELEPDHLSCYELEAKPGTRFTHRHGAALARQAEQLEDHYQHVIERLEGAGYRWYETANFCRDGRRARHNLAYWTGRDYLGLGIGAVSTLGLERRTNRPRLAPYIEAIADGRPPPRAVETLTPAERARERVILGLRLDEPVAVEGLADGLDPDGIARMTELGMVVDGAGTLALTRRGRLLANSVTAAVIS
jgi:oxygen-independent coproporphyrinogen-3 oxidase